MSQQFGWFKNKYQSGGGATFTPSVNINEIITANGYQYQATITSNIPNANLLVSMRGTIPESNIVGGDRNTSITTDSFGTATVIKDFETASSNTTFTFQSDVYNPNKLPDISDALMAQGNTVTLSGTRNNRIDVASYSGSASDINISNISVGSDTYTLYQFQVPGTFTFDITSVAGSSKEIQVFAVGAGSGACNVTHPFFGGGGGSGGALVTGNLTTTDGRLVCNANIGLGGVSADSGNITEGSGSKIFMHTEANVLVGGANAYQSGVGNGQLGSSTNLPGNAYEVIGGAGGGAGGGSGGGGGYAKNVNNNPGGSAVGGSTLNYDNPSSIPFPQANGTYSLGSSVMTNLANITFNGPVDSNFSFSYTPSIGNAMPLSYANTTVSGDFNIAGELAGRPGNTSIGGYANVGVGGVDFIFDFTGANASYSGGGAGQSEGNAVPGMPTLYTGYGSGGGFAENDAGNEIPVNGGNGIVMIRHIQNGTRALSM